MGLPLVPPNVGRLQVEYTEQEQHRRGGEGGGVLFKRRRCRGPSWSFESTASLLPVPLPLLLLGFRVWLLLRLEGGWEVSLVRVLLSAFEG